MMPDAQNPHQYPVGKDEPADFTITVEGKGFRVHKGILAENSEYFRAMFDSGMEESHKDCIELKGMTHSLVEILVDFIYTGAIKVTQDAVYDILDGALYLQIPAAIKACTDFLIASITGVNLVDILSLLESYSLWEAVKEVHLFLISNFQMIKSCSAEKICFKVLQLIIENWPDHFSDWELFQYIRTWLEAKFDERNQYLDSVFESVRFCLMTPVQLTSIQKLQVYAQSAGPLCRLVEGALEYHRLPVHLKILQDSEQSRVRTKPTAICFPWDACDPEPYFFALDADNHWIKSKPCEITTEGPDEVAASITVNNFLIISITLFCMGQEWHILDPHTLIWSRMPSMGGAHIRFGLVQSGEHLYTIGGDDSLDNHRCDIDRYSFQTNAWSPFFELPQPLVGHAACAYNDIIYISGGQHFNHELTLATVNSLNLTTKEWVTKAPLLEPMVDHKMGIMKLHQEDVIFVIDIDFHFGYYRMTTDQWSKCNFSFTNSLPQRGLGEVMLLDGNTILFLDVDHIIDWKNGVCIRAVIQENGKDVSIENLDFVPSRVQGEASGYLLPFGGILCIPAHHLATLNDK